GPANDVAVIDRALAARYWPGEDPLGKRIRNLANDAWIYPGRWLTVIGVVEAVRHDALIAEPRPTVYVNFRQRPARLSSATVLLRGTVPPDVLVARHAPTFERSTQTCRPSLRPCGMWFATA